MDILHFKIPMLIFQQTKSYSNLHMNDVPCQQHISKILYQNLTLIIHDTPKTISKISLSMEQV